MIKISNIKIPADGSERDIVSAAEHIAGVKHGDIKLEKILKYSVDSRKKPNVYKIYTAVFSAQNESAILKRSGGRITEYIEKRYAFPCRGLKSDVRPLIVGLGPAGIMAAMMLCEAGLKPIVIERGYDADRRTADVERFWSGGNLDESSNVLFGEGGAGLFSDGKLTTGVNDERIKYVFERFCQFGAPKDILYLSKPHIGTDILKDMIKNIRSHLISLGCEIRFGHTLTGLIHDGDKITAAEIRADGRTYTVKTGAVVLAVGNSARGTFEMLHDIGVKMEPKNFAVGVRIEHLQSKIDAAQYGQAATLGTLPASDYKLAVHLEGGRSVFTFCVCPGGYVVASASEKGGVVTNGMSEYKRDNTNINGGLLVSISTDDYNDELFGGIALQRKLEKSAYLAGGENYRAPAQLVGDFLNKTPSAALGDVIPSYRPGVRLCNLWDVLPEYICSALAEAIVQMDKKIAGFADKHAVLTAVETRSSSPVRIIRDENGHSSIRGLFPCGEGAGYAGGITTASVDGIKTAEKLCQYLSNC